MPQPADSESLWKVKLHDKPSVDQGLWLLTNCLAYCQVAEMDVKYERQS